MGTRSLSTTNKAMKSLVSSIDLTCGAKCWIESKSAIAVIRMDKDGNEISKTLVT